MPTVMLDEKDEYKMGLREDRELKRTRSYFIDDLKVYQETTRNLK